MEEEQQRSLLIIELPEVVLEQIFGNLSYDEIAKNRIVSQSLYKYFVLFQFCKQSKYGTN